MLMGRNFTSFFGKERLGTCLEIREIGSWFD
jgi:hypothetical protein